MSWLGLGAGAADATTAAVAGGAAWLWLRFFARHLTAAGGPQLIGDPRGEFEFLVFFPPPLRVALRPFEKVASTVGLPVIARLVALTVGAGGAAAAAASSAAAAGGVEGAAASATDSATAAAATAAAVAALP
jgi:hypothetical protein